MMSTLNLHSPSATRGDGLWAGGMPLHAGSGVCRGLRSCRAMDICYDDAGGAMLWIRERAGRRPRRKWLAQASA
jgi:hypothetical protein